MAKNKRVREVTETNTERPNYSPGTWGRLWCYGNTETWDNEGRSMQRLHHFCKEINAH